MQRMQLTLLTPSIKSYAELYPELHGFAANNRQVRSGFFLLFLAETVSSYKDGAADSS